MLEPRCLQEIHCVTVMQVRSCPGTGQRAGSSGCWGSALCCDQSSSRCCSPTQQTDPQQQGLCSRHAPVSYIISWLIAGHGCPTLSLWLVIGVRHGWTYSVTQASGEQFCCRSVPCGCQLQCSRRLRLRPKCEAVPTRPRPAHQRSTSLPGAQVGSLMNDRPGMVHTICSIVSCSLYRACNWARKSLCKPSLLCH